MLELRFGLVFLTSKVIIDLSDKPLREHSVASNEVTVDSFEDVHLDAVNQNIGFLFNQDEFHGHHPTRRICLCLRLE